MSDPVLGEDLLAYRRRLAQKFAKHSPKYKDAKLDMYDAQSISAAEDVIYADAAQSARDAPTRRSEP